MVTNLLLRSIAKNAAAHAIRLTGFDRLAHVAAHRDVPFVAAYHRVVDRTGAFAPFALPAMETSTAMLERHLDWIARHFTIISVDALGDALRKRSRSKPFAALTFDDGYSDAYAHAFPILKRKGIPAAFFVVTDLVGTKTLPIHERLHVALRSAARDPFAETQFLLAHRDAAQIETIIESLDPQRNADRLLGALRPMTWEMLGEMRDAGMTIGSHSKSHAFLANETPARIREEVAASRQTLQHRLGIRADSFAYPGGSFSTAVVDEVMAAGYRFGFTICRHRDRRNPSLTIPRTGLWEQSCLDASGRFSRTVMSAQAAGAFRFMSRCTQPHRRAQ